MGSPSASPARKRAPQADQPLSWPRDVSHVPEFSIGQVRKMVKPEFPALTDSKIRYLEEQGLISPTRTATGYRKFSRADIERLRFCLQVQRDSFQPLARIRTQLQELDAGAEATIEPTARIVASEGKLVSPGAGDVTVTARELLDYSGADQDLLDAVVDAALLTPDAAGRYPSRAVTVMQAVLTLRGCGVSPRNLRYVGLAAKRHMELIDGVSRPAGRDRSGADKERRLARAGELAGVLSRLATELLRMHLDTMD